MLIIEAVCDRDVNIILVTKASVIKRNHSVNGMRLLLRSIGVFTSPAIFGKVGTDDGRLHPKGCGLFYFLLSNLGLAEVFSFLGWIHESRP